MRSSKTLTETVLLCWHVESVAGSTDSLKPQALRVPSCRLPAGRQVGQGLTESAPPAPGKRAPAKQKKQRGLPLFCFLGIRGMQQQLFRRDHSTWMEELFHPPGKRAGWFSPAGSPMVESGSGIFP